MDEWTRQAQLERHLHLPASVTPSNDDPVVEANSQVFFISTFTYPLFALVASAIPRESVPATTLGFEVLILSHRVDSFRDPLPR